MPAGCFCQSEKTLPDCSKSHGLRGCGGLLAQRKWAPRRAGMRYDEVLAFLRVAAMNTTQSETQDEIQGETQNNTEQHGYFTLSGDVNSDMVRRVFNAAADITEDKLTTAHILIQSNGGYVSDGICLYNFLSKLPLDIITYNAGAVASIAVTLFLAGRQRHASDTARFMVHKSHATASPGSRPDALSIIVEGLRADDMRTERILRGHVNLTQEQWQVHAYSDLHLTAEQALDVGMIDSIRDFAPPKGKRLTNI
ncbi:ATP-dependent Clp protease, protease subunit [Janthinobacterium sp. OK676]|nr:ATP-dependent Clp protease protease subunit [Janthinobacterium sp. 67]SDN26487.1 ATP-dependent Clp protease, protease subunit [Janthinobacterium sp. OK676]